MRRTMKITSHILFAVFLLLAVTSQAQTTFTSRAAMGANETVDWGVLGATTPTLSGLLIANPFSNAASTSGLVVVNGVQPLGAFARVDEGSNWHGNFSPGDHLLTTGLNAGPVTITFAGGPVFGAGVQLQMQPLGPFTLVLSAFDSTGAVIATVTTPGNSTSPTIADNTAAFIGIRTPLAEIAKIELSCVLPTGRGNVLEVCAMNQLSVATQATPVVHRAHDFNGDGKADIVWHNSTTGDNVMWLMNGTSISGSALFATVADPNWQIVGAGDFNGDGKTDLLWRHSLTGDNAIYLMNGGSIAASSLFSTVADLSWHVVGVGDFNGDGKADILWRNSVTGENAVWLMNGASIAAGALLPAVADQNWQIAGVGDFNGDGRADILWRNSVTGDNVIWLMSSTSIIGGALFSSVTDLNWHVAGVADFNGDGKADILWRNSVTGDNALWLMNGTSITSGALAPAVSDVRWQIAGVCDFNGDGNADIVWRNPTTGDNVIWFMNGASITGGALFANVPGANWQIVP